MPVYLVTVLIIAAALWLVVHKTVRQRFAALETSLPITHRSAITVPPEGGHPPQLIALCVDLMRKTHCTDRFEDLAPIEQTMVLHAAALDALPGWMSHYAALTLSPANRAILTQLRQIKSSRPERPQEHFGAVKALLRSREES